MGSHLIFSYYLMKIYMLLSLIKHLLQTPIIIRFININCFYFQFESLGLAAVLASGTYVSTHRLHARLSRNLIYRMAHERDLNWKYSHVSVSALVSCRPRCPADVLVSHVLAQVCQVCGHDSKQHVILWSRRLLLSHLQRKRALR